MNEPADTPDILLPIWKNAWEPALARWSRFTRLSAPRWCLTEEDEKQEGLSASFAMIRLVDSAVVISLRKIVESGLGAFAQEILAHEIGHHVYCPADLTDNARMLARIRRGIPGKEHLAGFVSNLYSDLLINDRLQRQAGLNIAGVYRRLKTGDSDSLWTVYMRTYEILWSLPQGVLADVVPTAQIEGDAVLASRLVRSFSNRWLEGAGRFAALCLPYLMENNAQQSKKRLSVWMDAENAGEGGFPAGLTEIDGNEGADSVHPSLDPELNGLSGGDGAATTGTIGTTEDGGKKNTGKYRGPVEYGDLLRQTGLKLTSSQITARYYRERALPHLIPFPTLPTGQSGEKIPESWTRWDFGSPLSEVDWVQSVFRNPLVIPGVTTVKRTLTTVEGNEVSKNPLDLYVGIDCSGSMPDPAKNLSFPALAGCIVSLSALRAGGSVCGVLSGEPGKSIATDGFIREEQKVLELLTGYLGSGYAFGIHRLTDTLVTEEKYRKPVHLLLITDQDIFSMLESSADPAKVKSGHRTGEGWTVAKESLDRAGGGGTMVLHMPPGWRNKEVDRLKEQGWNVYRIYDWSELIAFAAAFSRRLFSEQNVAQP